MRNGTTITLALAAALLASAGCDKTPGTPAGSGILFSVSLSSRGDGTRTAYSGVVTDGAERIDWRDGDLLRIGCSRSDGSAPFAADDYAVVGRPVAAGRQSFASVECGGGGLTWGDCLHDFTAVSPAPSTPLPGGGTLADAGVYLADGEAGAYIPAVQALTWNGNVGLPDMTYAPLMASVRGVAPLHTVMMPFRPAFNAYEFVFGYQNNSPITVNSFSLTSGTEALAGAFSFAFHDGTGRPLPDAATLTPPAPVLSGDGANNRITVPLGVTLGQDEWFTFTVFTLPGDHGGLTVSLDTDFGTKSLLLQRSDGTPIVFPSCGKAKLNGLVIPNSPAVSFINVILVEGEEVITDLLEPWTGSSEEGILVRQ